MLVFTLILGSSPVVVILLESEFGFLFDLSAGIKVALQKVTLPVKPGVDSCVLTVDLLALVPFASFGLVALMMTGILLVSWMLR